MLSFLYNSELLVINDPFSYPP